MKIISLSAKNFRTLENLELSFDAYYCTLSGQNNAGKSAVVQVIRHFLENTEENRFYGAEFNRIRYDKDKTQWASGGDIKLSLTIELGREVDSEVFFVVEKLSGLKLEGEKTEIILSQTFEPGDSIVTECKVRDTIIESQSSSEILKKIRSASNLVVHNSTIPIRNFYYRKGGVTEILEVHISDSDRLKIETAEKVLGSKVQAAAKQHKEELSKLLGKLQDKYDVKLTTLERGSSSGRFPLSVSLTDNNVEVPLGDWGAGTQNRTRILMSILDAVRIQNAVQAENRSTPVVLVEEPESFLHPSAQAEFGKILNELSEELKIQIIATTHSPNMLNQRIPEANILLQRKMFRRRLKETLREPTTGDNWMLPFAQNLGVIPDEFSKWQSVISSAQSYAILVEGPIDQQYFTHFKENYPNIYKINNVVEVIPYGGKDALKNTHVLKFMLSRFSKVFVTYDLDCEKDIENSLQSIELKKDDDYCSVGKNGPGKDCIEGLLPNEIKQAVYGREVELVTALTSADAKERKSAKNKLKTELLNELRNTTCEDSKLSEFKSLFAKIAKSFA